MSRDIILKGAELQNGETLAYREAGQGDRNIIFIHGNMGTSLNWDLPMEEMPDGIRMIAVDLRGFGFSSYNKPIGSIRDLSEDLYLLAQSLELNDIIMAGWSGGGTVAMQFAIDHPKLVKKLILVDSSSIKGYPTLKRNIMGRTLQGQYVKTIQEMEQLLEPFKNIFEKKSTEEIKRVLDLVYTNKKPSEDKYSKYVEAAAKQRNIADFNYALSIFNISEANNGVVDGTGEMDKIKMPVLVVQGEVDKLVTMDMARDIQQGIGKNATIAEMKNCGHVPFCDNTQEFVEILCKFIEN